MALDGNQALEYVRARHLQYYDAQTGEWQDASPRADLDRITRQQNFIRRLAAAASAKGASNPLTAYEIADATIPKLKIDKQLSKDDIFRLVNTFRKVNPEDNSAIEMITLPVQSRRRDGSAGGASSSPTPIRSSPGCAASARRPPTRSIPKLLPSQVRVRVLNASGIDGAAGEALAGLQRYSFAPAGVGNTKRLTATEIHYRPGNEDKAKLVARYLGGVGRLVSDGSISDADVVVMLAKDYQGITAPAGAKSTTTTTLKKSTSGSSDTTKPAAPAAETC